MYMSSQLWGLTLIKAFSQTHSMLQSTTSIKACKTLSMAKHTRGQGSYLGNETKISVPALIPIESSNLCENTRAYLEPQIKITARLLLL